MPRSRCRRASAGAPRLLAGPAVDHGGRAGRDRDHLSRNLCPGLTGTRDQERARRRLRQSLQSRSLLPAGRRHGPHRRAQLYLHALRKRSGGEFPTSSSTTAARSSRASATRSPAGPRSTRSREYRCGTFALPPQDLGRRQARSGVAGIRARSNVALQGVAQAIPAMEPDISRIPVACAGLSGCSAG